MMNDLLHRPAALAVRRVQRLDRETVERVAEPLRGLLERADKPVALVGTVLLFCPERPDGVAWIVHLASL